MKQSTERDIYNGEINQEDQLARENNVVASGGLLLGILLTLVCLSFGTYLLLNQSTDTQSPNQSTSIERTK